MIDIELTDENIGQNSYFAGANECWFVYYGKEKPIDRPASGIVFNGSSYTSYYTLNNILHFWLIENNIEYSLKEVKRKDSADDTYYNTVIIFENKVDAMLFKLTWC